jgi:hypothetical protein
MSGSIKCIPARADVHKAQPLDWRPLARPLSVVKLSTPTHKP